MRVGTKSSSRTKCADPSKRIRSVRRVRTNQLSQSNFRQVQSAFRARKTLVRTIDAPPESDCADVPEQIDCQNQTTTRPDTRREEEFAICAPEPNRKTTQRANTSNQHHSIGQSAGRASCVSQNSLNERKKLHHAIGHDVIQHTAHSEIKCRNEQHCQTNFSKEPHFAGFLFVLQF